MVEKDIKINEGYTMDILILNNDTPTAELTATSLREELNQVSIEIVARGIQALDRLEESDFDCVVSEAYLPGMDVVEFLETVRDKYPHLPVILFTNNGDEDLAAQAISAGLTDYVQKNDRRDTQLADSVTDAVEQFLTAQVHQHHFRAIETATEGISILDEDGEYVFVNEAYASLYGYDPDEMIGRHWKITYPDEDVAFARDELLPTVREEGYWHGETTGLRADGTTFIEDHTLATTSNGALICTVRDVSEQKEQQREIQKFQQRFERFSQAVSTGFFLISQDYSKTFFVNDAVSALYGIDPERALADPSAWLEHVHPADRESLQESVERQQKGAVDWPVTQEFRVQHPADGVKWISTSIQPIRDQQGDIIELAGVARDITERRRRQTAQQEQYETLIELMNADAVAEGDIQSAVEQITEATADVLRVPRVSVWLIGQEDDTLDCVDTYIIDNDSHNSSESLNLTQYPAYQDALETHRSIDAESAQSDPRTCELTKGYLKPNAITSLLDAPIRSDGEVVGVVCFEQTNEPRQWTPDEIAYAGQIADLLSRTLRNQELKEANAELNRITRAIDEAPVGITISDPSQDDNPLIYANKAFESITGYDRMSVLGQNCRFLQGEKTRDEKVDKIRDAINTQEAATVELRNYQESGEMFWNRFTVAPVFDENGNLVNYVGFQEDVSEWKEQRQELKRLQRAIEATSDAVLITDTDGEIIYTNSAFEDITGYSSSEVYGKTPRILKSDQRGDEFYERMWETILSGEPFSARLINQRKNGQRYVADQSINPVLNSAGDIEWFVAVQRDVTSEQQRINHLQVLSRILRHNIRNSMNVIRGRAETISMNTSGGPARNAENIINKSDELVRISEKQHKITSLLISEPEIKRTAVAEVLSRARESLIEKYPKAIIKTECKGVLNMAVVSQFSEAITELLRNAIIHSDQKHPEVMVTAGETDNQIQLSIIDDGPPLPEIEKQVLIEGTYGGKLAHSNGLGLWLVHWIVQLSGGTVQIRRENDRGNQITLSLPKVQRQFNNVETEEDR
jgi:PAS domain S-box-containing protein